MRKQIFKKISSVKGSVKTKTLKTKTSTVKTAYFDFNDYQIARVELPELFEWLDYPDQYVQQFIKQQQESQRIIKHEDFAEYHSQV